MFEALTLDQLRLFLTVAEEGTFSAAGRKLGRVQSAVSQGIGNLEGVLGVELFDRSRRRPELTPAGQALLLNAQQVFTQVNGLQTRAATMAQGVEAEVSVVVDQIVPAQLLVQMCRGFQAEFPTVVLRIFTEVLEGVIDRVIDGTCDVGIAGPIGLNQTSLTRRFLMNVALVPVVGPDHKLAQLKGAIPTADVRDQIQIVISGLTKAKGEDHGVLSQHTWRVANASTKISLLRAGLGWGTLPCEMVRDDLVAGTLVKLHLEEWGPLPRKGALSSIVRSNSPLGPAARWLYQHLESNSTD